MKTNRQIADECAQAVWSWLCERYGIPLPTIQQVLKDLPSNGQLMKMPGYRISMTQKKSSSVSGLSDLLSTEVTIAGKSLRWLSKCRLNNPIESWTLQFVGEFTRVIEFHRRVDNGRKYDDVFLRSTLNQIDFAKRFFPHLYRKHREMLVKLAKRMRSDLQKQNRQHPKPSSSGNLSTPSSIPVLRQQDEV